MAQFKVEVSDDKGNVVASKTVDATDYVDACAEVVRRANRGGGSANPQVPVSGPPSAGTAPTSTGSDLDGPDKLSENFRLS